MVNENSLLLIPSKQVTLLVSLLKALNSDLKVQIEFKFSIADVSSCSIKIENE